MFFYVRKQKTNQQTPTKLDQHNTSMCGTMFSLLSHFYSRSEFSIVGPLSKGPGHDAKKPPRKAMGHRDHFQCQKAEEAPPAEGL